MDDGDQMELTFRDTDFQDRTVLKLIIQNQFEPLLRDVKISALLELLWVGKNSYNCDGKLSDFSLLSYLSTAQLRKLPGQDIEFGALIGSQFNESIHSQIEINDYQF